MRSMQRHEQRAAAPHMARIRMWTALTGIVLAGLCGPGSADASPATAKRFGLVMGVDMRRIRRSGSWAIVAPKIAALRASKKYKAAVRACHCDPLAKASRIDVGMTGSFSQLSAGATAVVVCARLPCQMHRLESCLQKPLFRSQIGPLTHTTMSGRKALIGRKRPDGFLFLNRHTVCMGERPALELTARLGGIGPGQAPSVPKRFRSGGAAFWVVATSLKLKGTQIQAQFPGVQRFSYAAVKGVWGPGHWNLYLLFGLPTPKQAGSVKTALEHLTQMLTAMLKSRFNASSRPMWVGSKPKLKGSDVSMELGLSKKVVGELLVNFIHNLGK